MTAVAILAEAYRDAGVPDGVFNLVMGPGEHGRRRRSRRTRASTGSSSPARTRSGCDLFRTFSKR